jgi:hypothetical protein
LAGLSQVEHQLLCDTDVELTDTNVVDYLLDVSTDNSNNKQKQQQQEQRTNDANCSKPAHVISAKV